MGTDTGVSGFFGILLNMREELEIKAIVEEIDEWVQKQGEDFDDWHVDENEDEVTKRFFPRVYDMLHSVGIILPEGAGLIYTGSPDDRPCRVATSGEQWGVGFGLLTWPWNWPEMDESFKKAGDWHTWTWMG